MGVIDNAVQWATDIANDDSHWYSQDVRWGPHYDCSSFVITAYQNAGVPVKIMVLHIRGICITFLFRVDLKT